MQYRIKKRMCQVILGKNYKPLIYIASKLAVKVKQSCRQNL